MCIEGRSLCCCCPSGTRAQSPSTAPAVSSLVWFSSTLVGGGFNPKGVLLATDLRRRYVYERTPERLSDGTYLQLSALSLPRPPQAATVALWNGCPSPSFDSKSHTLPYFITGFQALFHSRRLTTIGVKKPENRAPTAVALEHNMQITPQIRLKITRFVLVNTRAIERVASGGPVSCTSPLNGTPVPIQQLGLTLVWLPELRMGLFQNLTVAVLGGIYLED